MGDAGMEKKDIHEVVLVGGSTRIPKIVTMIKDQLDKEPNKSINPDEAVAYGAAVQAAILSGSKDELAGIPPAPRGVPQIEVTFDIDANGIMNVSAKESAGGKTEKIVITNDKGRLSKEEIEKMVNDAEKYAKEDEKVKAKVDAKNKLENYLFSMKSTIEDEKFADKISDDDKETIKGKVDEITKWMDDNSSADVDEYESKQKEIEGVCNPIVQKLYAAAGGDPSGMPGGIPGGMPDMSGASAGGASSGPTIEEV